MAWGLGLGGAGCGGGQSDVHPGAVAGQGLSQRVGVQGSQVGRVGGQGGIDQVLKIDERVSGLLRPAPPLPGRVVIGDGLQFAQHVGVAQGVGGVLVRVVRGPGVMHRDPAKVREHPGGTLGSRQNGRRTNSMRQTISRTIA